MPPFYGLPYVARATNFRRRGRALHSVRPFVVTYTYFSRACLASIHARAREARFRAY